MAYRPCPTFVSLALLLAVGIVLSGCGSPQTRVPTGDPAAAEREAMAQKRLVVENKIEARNRVGRIDYYLRTAGHDLCGRHVEPAFGFLILNRHAFEEAFWGAAKEAAALDDAVTVSYVIPASVAEEAGMRAGDRLVKVDDWVVPSGKEAVDDTLDTLASFETNTDSVTLTVERGGEEYETAIKPGISCKFPSVVGQQDTVNAYADGKRIVIERGMLRFAETDEELAFVVAHELAHNAMGHVRSKRRNALIGGALGLIVDVAGAVVGVNTQGTFTEIGARVGAGSYSVEFEQEADYVGLYMMKRAGFEIAEAADFWRRMAIEHPESIQMRRTHPTTPERFVAIETAVDEIDLKAAQGLPLSPEMKH